MSEQLGMMEDTMGDKDDILICPPAPTSNVIGTRASLSSGPIGVEESIVRNVALLPDGSISPVGFFNGLNRVQAKNSLLQVQQEYTRFISSLQQSDRPMIAADSSAGVMDTRATGDDDDNCGGKGGEYGATSTNEREKGSAENEDKDNDGKRYQELCITWGKRNWRTQFELYTQYDGNSDLKVSVWNRLLTWLWTTLSEEHMIKLHELLTCLRTDNNPCLPNISYVKSSGLTRSHLQQDLIQNYHQVLQSESKEDVDTIRQRFQLTKLYTSHCAYVEQYRTQGNKIQTARHKVNQLLFRIFNQELRRPVSQQTIGNHVKEGRHWYELLNSKETKSFGHGLILILPLRGYANIVRQTADAVWAFIINHLFSMSPRLVRLAISMQPIAKAALEFDQVTDAVAHNTHQAPMIGYELRSATSLHEVSRTEFDACLTSHPDIGIPETLATIVAHTRRSSDPMVIVRLVKQDWANKNVRDGHAFQARAHDLQRSVQRDITNLQHEAHKRLYRTALVLPPPPLPPLPQSQPVSAPDPEGNASAQSPLPTSSGVDGQRVQPGSGIQVSGKFALIIAEY